MLWIYECVLVFSLFLCSLNYVFVISEFVFMYLVIYVCTCGYICVYSCFWICVYVFSFLSICVSSFIFVYSCFYIFVYSVFLYIDSLVILNLCSPVFCICVLVLMYLLIHELRICVFWFLCTCVYVYPSVSDQKLRNFIPTIK